MGLEQKVRVVIVDDHPLFRQGLRAAIDEAPDLRWWAKRLGLTRP